MFVKGDTEEEVESAFLLPPPTTLAELPIVKEKEPAKGWEADSPQADCRGLADPDELE